MLATYDGFFSMKIILKKKNIFLRNYGNMKFRTSNMKSGTDLPLLVFINIL